MKHQQGVQLAYIGEYFHRVEKLDKNVLYEALGKKEEIKNEMSDAEMLINIHQLNAALGGKVE